MRILLAESRVFGGKRAPFQLREVKGARRIIVRVTHEGVVVTKPRWVSRRQVDRFLEDCDGWVVDQLETLDERVAEALSDTVLYLGRIRRIRRASALPVRWANEEFWAPGLRPEDRLESTMAWMRQRARKRIREAVAKWAPELNVRPKRVSIRDQVSRWGSCSADGSLSFNWRLIMAPSHVLEYIVIHELAHIRHHNHSKRFWSYVEQFCPDYEACEKWLDDHNDRMMFAGRCRRS